MSGARDFTTLVNGQPSQWSGEILAKWISAIADSSAPQGANVVRSNYFTPRPFRNAWDRGNADEGFTYTTACGGDRNVWQVVINREDPRP